MYIFGTGDSSIASARILFLLSRMISNIGSCVLRFCSRAGLVQVRRSILRNPRESIWRVLFWKSLSSGYFSAILVSMSFSSGSGLSIFASRANAIISSVDMSTLVLGMMPLYLSGSCSVSQLISAKRLYISCEILMPVSWLNSAILSGVPDSTHSQKNTNSRPFRFSISRCTSSQNLADPMCIIDWKITVFSPLLMVIFGRVAGAVLLVNWMNPTRIQGMSQVRQTSQAQPCRKFRINLCHRVLSSCFPKIIPTSPRATPHPIVTMMEIGMSARKTPIPTHDPSDQLSQRFAINDMRKILPSSIGI